MNAPHPSPARLEVDHPVVDSDGHVIEPADMWQRYLPSDLRDRAPVALYKEPLKTAVMVEGMELPRPTKSPRYKGMSRSRHQERLDKPLAAGFSPASQVAVLDEEGIDVSVLFPTRGLLVMGVTGIEPRLTTAYAEAYNRWLGDFCSEHPQRLVGAAALDARDVEGACKEARRAVREHGFCAVFLRPNFVDGRPWHDPAYDPLWSELEDLNVPLCFHEGSTVYLPQVGPDRFGEHAYWHTCTHPMEQQIAMLSILAGGVAERHPRLRVAFLECGAGWLPYWLWRIDEHIETEEDEFPHLKLMPSEYAKRQCFVSIDSDEYPGSETIAQGHSVVWGSDYPHSDGKFPVAARTLHGLDGMDAARFREVVYETPQKLFGRSFSRR